MRNPADAAHEFSLKCGTWLNKERAVYLYALVANALAQLGDAQGHRSDLAIAESTAQSWEDASLKTGFAGGRARIRTL